jgi:type II secretory pathway component GspD/PulD (secretin)
MIVSLGLLGAMLVRWRQVARDARRAAPAPALHTGLLPELPRSLRVRLTDAPQSPAVCGLFRPVILLPRSLAEQLPPAQLRAVLLHELFHLRRGDIWVNCLQGLLQVVYWWHPLLWLANARIRRVREEAVDDAVMLALKADAETYAPTLLEVAKLALQRPMAGLGLVGILESRSALRQRIERLMDFHPPRRAGLGLVSVLGVLGFAALAVPMGEAPAPSATSEALAPPVATNSAVLESPSSAAPLPDQQVKARELMHDGKLLYEMGKLAEAQAKLTRAAEQDPQNQSAHYYLELVRNAQRGQPQASGEWLPTPSPNSWTNAVITSPARQRLTNAKVGPELYTRSMKVDPNRLAEALHVPAGPAEKNWLAALVTALRERLAKAGVDLDPVSSPAKGLFLNDRLGMLLVRATMSDLNVIEGVIARLNTPSQQINIKAKFFELTQSNGKELGFDWYLGNTAATNRTEAFPGSPPAWTNTMTVQHNLGTQSVAPFLMTGILTEPQSRVVLNALEQRSGSELLAAPQVITLSGRQAQFKISELHSVVWGINPRALTPPGLTNAAEASGSLYLVKSVETGPMLDVNPTVLEDGCTIHLPVIVSLSEFLGYEENPTNRVAVYVKGKRKWITPPRPRTQQHQMTATVNLYDGQTVVLGGLVSEQVSVVKDKVAGLGDLPLVGKLFTSENKTTQKRDLLVFVTASLVDPAGNLVHKAEQLPSGVPPQSAR